MNTGIGPIDNAATVIISLCALAVIVLFFIKSTGHYAKGNIVKIGIGFVVAAVIYGVAMAPDSVKTIGTQIWNATFGKI